MPPIEDEQPVQALLADRAGDPLTDGTGIRRLCARVPGPDAAIIVLDNLSVHKAAEARALVEARGYRLLFLPAYSPDLNPIELACAKRKEALRHAGARTKAALETARAAALSAITAADARGWFAACGNFLAETQPLC